MRRAHRAPRRRAGARLRDAGVGRGRQDRDHDQGPRHAGQAASAAGGLRRRAGAAVRLLRQWLDHDRGRGAEEESARERGRAARVARRAQVPLRHPRIDPARHQARAAADGIGGAMLSRREFFKTSGALVISFASPAFTSGVLAQAKPGLVPSELDSWIAVLPDGRAQAFFGKMDMGQGLDIAVAQIVAEELDVGFDKVEVVMGDTATSCNQGGASGSTGVSNGARLLRRAAAEARRVLVERASKQLEVPVSQLSVENGVVAGSAKKISYAELIGGKYLHHQVEWNKLSGNPMDIKVAAKEKAPADYKVVGKRLAGGAAGWKGSATTTLVTTVGWRNRLHGA